MKRQIIEIDEKKCTGCGLCVPECPEGALQIIDGKARLVSDLFCDGLGACLGDCPEGAITTIEREAEPYDESRVMENIIAAGPNTIRAHLKHLKDHGQTKYYDQAVDLLMQKGLSIPVIIEEVCQDGGCPGSASIEIKREDLNIREVKSHSELRQWPVQLHLVNSSAPWLENADILFSADCAPFAYADFHQRFMKGKVVINFCPKLDRNIEDYVEKLIDIFKNRNINSITIVRMEVPCCGGMEKIIQEAMEKSGKLIMPRVNIISIKGEIV